MNATRVFERFLLQTVWQLLKMIRTDKGVFSCLTIFVLIRDQSGMRELILKRMALRVHSLPTTTLLTVATRV